MSQATPEQVSRISSLLARNFSASALADVAPFADPIGDTRDSLAEVARDLSALQEWGRELVPGALVVTSFGLHRLTREQFYALATPGTLQFLRGEPGFWYATACEGIKIFSEEAAQPEYDLRYETAPDEWCRLDPRCSDQGSSFLVFSIDRTEVRDIEVECTLMDHRYD